MEVLFIKGITAGLLLGIPAGPLAAIALRRMITKCSHHGLFFALAYAIVDILYTCIAALGLNYALSFVAPFQKWIFIIGGIIFIAFGVKMFFTKITSVDENGELKKKDYLGSFMLAFLIALTNPYTILSFAVVFATFNLSFTTIFSFAALQIILGVVIGGALWWILLSIAIRYFKTRVTIQSMTLINRFFGIMIIAIVVIMWIYYLRV